MTLLQHAAETATGTEALLNHPAAALQPQSRASMPLHVAQRRARRRSRLNRT
ncbi:MAG: hypothetical protein AAF607_12365 [Pseudomonadota bacterium]